METYEVFARRSDPSSERLLEALLDRRVPFVEIQLADRDAEALEQVAGARLPFVMQGRRLVGGFADLVTHLRVPRARPFRSATAC